ncbi:glycosyltransferase family 4 protein [Candidatus Parcubacteria bacterium]|nr:glycosyltransferase family 4 protein [Patescibacteria group bacterium]MBU4309397.1 glycosyltransferase family 4 protein [Patescibacteria group bacterium]MBU4431748.1 glycosyltransferase family 4 protein [Patescibacteria group bacterium]MBU4577758.1 glycosyltransferase family 4 protein [Patescibacteria group bacterium]MCG2697443.1 glycosyltransferase family 4 protein [Candidatus Parcubacteria bacterium]
MKILQINCVYPPYKSGMSNSVARFGEQLVAAGDEATVMTLDFGHKAEEVIGGVKVIRLKPWLRLGLAGFLPQLLWKLRGYDAVVLHYPFFGAAEVVWLAKLLYGKKIKLFIYYHMDTGELVGLARALSLPARMIKTMLFRQAEKIMVSSLDYAEHGAIGDYYLRNKEQFVEIPFGVDIEKFKCVKCSSKTDPSQDGELNFVLDILFVAALDRAHYFKGVDILLHAVGRLRERGISNWRLNIVGDGDMRREYELLAKSLNIGDRVVFRGRLSDEELVNIYKTVNLFILSSINNHEAFGIVLIEAMASGNPVVASNLPGVRSVFVDGEQGFLSRPGDIEDLKKKIALFVQDENLSRTMGNRARRLVEEKYSLGVMGKKFREILQL